MQSIPVEFPTTWIEYELTDSGNGEKFERFGPPESGFKLIRPDPRILWQPTHHLLWDSADAVFTRTGPDLGTWSVKRPPPTPWKISYRNLTFTLKPTEFKHTGVFPEQAVNWDWLTKKVAGQNLSTLNLFAYTGGATMAMAAAGATVVHLDSSKSTITWARENIQVSGLAEKPIRFIEDDAVKFVEREIRRGNTYDGIVLDPPRFGRGTHGEIWKLTEQLPSLVHNVEKLMSPNASFLLINAYTADISAIALYNLVASVLKDRGGTISLGELCLQERLGKRLVPHGIFVRWEK